MDPRSIYNEIQEHLGPGVQAVNEIQSGIYIGPIVGMKTIHLQDIKRILILAPALIKCCHQFNYRD